MYTGDLIIVDKDNNTRHEIALAALFSKEEYDSHVSDTSAGPLWGKSSFYYIMRHADVDYFCMHCWTGKRLIINLSTGIMANPKEFAAILDATEEEEILELLSQCAKDVAESGKGLEWERLYGAMSIIGKKGMTQTQRELEILEQHSWHGGMTTHSNWGYGKGLRKDIRENWYEILDGRQHARLALRRLGLKTKGYSPYVFEKAKEDAAITDAARRQRATEFGIGHTSQQVYDGMGSPDYMMTAMEDDDTKGYAYRKRKWTDAWRYDFGIPNDFSLIFIWDDQGRVDRIEKITPSLWRGDDLFSDKVKKPIFRANGNINGIHLYSPHFLGKIEVIEKKAEESNEAIESDKK